MGHKKGEITEITTVVQDDEEPVTTVTVERVEEVPEFEEPTVDEPIVIEELPEVSETFVTKDQKGRTHKKTIKKRKIKKIVDGQEHITEITSVQEGTDEPVTTVTFKTPDDDVTDDQEEVVRLPEVSFDNAAIVQEMPEEVTVSEVVTRDGPKKRIVRKRILKKKVGPKEVVTEITTTQEDEDEPVTSVVVTENVVDETAEPYKPDKTEPTSAHEVEEVPEVVIITTIKTSEGTIKKRKTKKRIIKKDLGPQQEITEIITEEEEGELPVTTVTVQVVDTDVFDSRPIVEEPVDSEPEEHLPEITKRTKIVKKKIIKKKSTKPDEEDKPEEPEIIEEVLETKPESEPEELVPEITEIHKTKKIITKKIIKKKSTAPDEEPEHIDELPQEPEETSVEQPEIIKKENNNSEEDHQKTTTTSLHEPEEPEETIVEPVEEIKEYPEEVVEEIVPTLTGTITKKTIKRRIVKKMGHKKGEITEITTVVQDDEEPVTTVTVERVEEVPEFEEPTVEEPIVIEELPEVSETFVTKDQKGRTHKKTIKKRKIKKIVDGQEHITEITSVQEGTDEPVTTVTFKTPDDDVTDDQEEVVRLPEVSFDNAAIVQEMPEEVTVSEVVTRDGPKKRIVRKRILKKKVGPKEEVTEITTTQEDEEEPVTSVVVTENVVDETAEPYKPDETEPTSAHEVEEVPEVVIITTIKTSEGTIKKRKTKKRIIKKDLGPQQEITEIITEEEEGELPVTTVTVQVVDTDVFESRPIAEEPVESEPEEHLPEITKRTKIIKKKIIKKKSTKPDEEDKPAEPETIEEVTETKPESEPEELVPEITEILKTKKIIKNKIIKKKSTTPDEEPQLEEPEKIDELPQEPEETSVEQPEIIKKKTIIRKKITKTTTTPSLLQQEEPEEPLFEPFEEIKEYPEEIVEETFPTLSGTVTKKTIKRRIVKKMGPKKGEITEITTVVQDDEEPVTTVTVERVDEVPEFEEPTVEEPIVIEELPETTETFLTKDEMGKTHKKIIKKRKIKKIVDGQEHITEITSVQEGTKEPMTTVTFKTPDDDVVLDEDELVLLPQVNFDNAATVQEMPEEVTVSEVITKDGPKTKIIRKRILKKKIGPKEEVTEITTTQEEDKEPVTSVVVTENEVDETTEPYQPFDKIPEETHHVEEIPEVVTIKETKSIDGKIKTKRVTKRVIKKDLGDKQEFTEITSIEEDGESPVTTVNVQVIDSDSLEFSKPNDDQPSENTQLPQKHKAKRPKSKGISEQTNTEPSIHKPIILEETPITLEETIDLQDSAYKPKSPKTTTHESQIENDIYMTQDKPEELPYISDDQAQSPTDKNSPNVKFITEDFLSPQSSDNEKIEEIVTKFERSSDSVEAKKVTTKRTIIRKKKTKNVRSTSPQQDNTGDIVIEEMWDDDTQDIKPNIVSQSPYDVSIEECEPNTTDNTTVMDEKATVQFQDDDNNFIPEKIHEHTIGIEEIELEPETEQPTKTPVEKSKRIIKKRTKKPEDKLEDVLPVADDVDEPAAIIEPKIKQEPEEVLKDIPAEKETTKKRKIKKKVDHDVDEVTEPNKKPTDIPDEIIDDIIEEELPETEKVDDSKPQIIKKKIIKKKSIPKDNKDIVELDEPATETIEDQPIDEKIEDIEPKIHDIKKIPKKKSVKPGKIDDDDKPDKKEPEDVKLIKKVKLVPCKIEHKQQLANKVQILDSTEIPLFALKKLTKTVKTPKPEQRASIVPKILLKSRIRFNLDWPPQEFKSVISYLGSVRDNGILSRNAKEAMKIKTKKYKPKIIPELETTVLETPEFTLEEIIKTSTMVQPLEPQIKEQKEVTEPKLTKPKKIVIGKGEVIEDQPKQEEVTLRKTVKDTEPQPDDSEKEPKPVPEEEKKPLKKKKDQKSPKLDKLEPFETPQDDTTLLKYEKPDDEIKSEPESEDEVDKYKRPLKTKRQPETIETILKKGIPKKPLPEEDESVKFRIPDRPSDVDEIEERKLKPFTKSIPADENDTGDAFNAILPTVPTSDSAPITMDTKEKPKKKSKKPKDKHAEQTEIEEMPVDKTEVLPEDDTQFKPAVPTSSPTEDITFTDQNGEAQPEVLQDVQDITPQEIDKNLPKEKVKKRIIKQKIGEKQEVTEITTLEKDGEEPSTTIVVESYDTDVTPQEPIKTPKDKSSPKPSKKDLPLKQSVQEDSIPEEILTELKKKPVSEKQIKATFETTSDTISHIKPFVIESTEDLTDTSLTPSKAYPISDGTIVHEITTETKSLLQDYTLPSEKQSPLACTHVENEHLISSEVNTKMITDDFISTGMPLKEEPVVLLQEEYVNKIEVSDTIDVKQDEIPKTHAVKRSKEIKLESTETLDTPKPNTEVISESITTHEGIPTTLDQSLESVDKFKVIKDEVQPNVEVEEKETHSASITPSPKIKKRKPTEKKDDVVTSEIDEIVIEAAPKPDTEPKIPETTDTPEKPKKVKDVPKKGLMKLVPIKIERKEIKASKVQVVETSEIPLFAQIKLKKAIVPVKKDIKTRELPKVLLKSHIIFISDWPSEELKPIIHHIHCIRDAGILSRNAKEAMKIQTKKYVDVKIPELQKVVLEKPSFGYEDIVSRNQEIEEKPKEPEEPKLEKIDESSFNIKLGKGKIPQPENISEDVNLKPIPKESNKQEMPEKDKVEILELPESKPGKTEPEDGTIKFVHSPDEDKTIEKPEDEPVVKKLSKKPKRKESVEENVIPKPKEVSPELEVTSPKEPIKQEEVKEVKEPEPEKPKKIKKPKKAEVVPEEIKPVEVTEIKQIEEEETPVKPEEEPAPVSLKLSKKPKRKESIEEAIITKPKPKEEEVSAELEVAPLKEPTKEEEAVDTLVIKYEVEKEDVKEPEPEKPKKIKKPKKTEVVPEEIQPVEVTEVKQIEEEETPVKPEEEPAPVSVKLSKKPKRKESIEEAVTIKPKPKEEEVSAELEVAPLKEPTKEEEAVDTLVIKYEVEKDDVKEPEPEKPKKIKKPKKTEVVPEEIQPVEATEVKQIEEVETPVKPEEEPAPVSVKLSKKPKRKESIEEAVTIKPKPKEEEVSAELEVAPLKEPTKEEEAVDTLVIKYEVEKEDVKEPEPEKPKKIKKPKKTEVVPEEIQPVEVMEVKQIEEEEVPVKPEEEPAPVSIKLSKKPKRKESIEEAVTIKPKPKEEEEVSAELVVAPVKKPTKEEEAVDTLVIKYEVEKEDVKEPEPEKPKKIKKPKKTEVVPEEIQPVEVMEVKQIEEEEVPVKPEEEPAPVSIKLSKKPKRKESIEEAVTIKPKPKEEEEVSAELEVAPVKKPTKEEEAVDSLVIKYEVEKEDVKEPEPEKPKKIKKPKKTEVVPEEVQPVEVMEVKQIEEEEVPVKPEEEPAPVSIKLSKKPKRKESIEEAITIKPIKMKPNEEEDVSADLQVAPAKKPTLEEEGEALVIKYEVEKEDIKDSEPEKPKKIKKPKKPEISSEEIVPVEITEEKQQDDILVPEKKDTSPKENIDDQETSDNDRPEEFSIKKKPKDVETQENYTLRMKTEEEETEFADIKIPRTRKKSKVSEEHEEEITIKKLRPVRKSSTPNIVEITEPESVTFRPKMTKTKEDVEQEFKIHLDSYAEEEISMSSKVKLKSQKQPTFTEESEETSIKIYPEFDSTEDNVEEIIDYEITRKSDTEPKDSTEDFEEESVNIKKKTTPLPEEVTKAVKLKKSKPKTLNQEEDNVLIQIPDDTPDNFNIKLNAKKSYNINDEDDVSFDIKQQRDTYSEEELSLTSKIKIKNQTQPTFSEEAGEAHIKLTREVESDDLIDEIILSEGESESENIQMILRPKKMSYQVNEVEEEIMLGFKPTRRPTETFEEDYLTLSKKRPAIKPTFAQEAVSMSISKEAEAFEQDTTAMDIREGDIVFAVYSYVAETDEAINLVEGERLYIIETHNQDWWFVKKHLTEEKGWVPAQYLMDEVNYNLYLQKKLNEKIDKLPVFEKPSGEELAIAPRFIEKLRPKHTPDGYTVQFECQVEGYPRPQITWFRQTAIIKPSQDFQIYYDDDNVATLIIREVFPEDAGTFTCVAKNAAGFASSTTELVVEAPLSDHGSEMTVLSRKSLSRESSLADILEGIPPTFSKKPRAQYVNEGSQIFLECRLVAVPEPEITWLFAGKRIIPNEKTTIVTESDMHMYCSVLKIDNVQKSEEGTYEVVAINREGEASLPIVLKIKTGDKEKPEVIEPFVNLTIREGESIVLSTQIVGNPTPKISWFKNNKPIKTLSTKSDGDTHMVTLINPKKGVDDGVYTVKATNSQGSAETSGILTIEESTEDNSEPPLFIERFQELSVPEKKSITLTAKVVGYPIPSITWLRNNKVLEPSKRVNLQFDGENIVLKIENADSEIDSGDYKCIASNVAGKICHGAKVTVDVERVTFIRNLQESYEVNECETVILECETSHTVSTKWYQNGKEISGMDHREIIQESKIHKLRIKKTKITDTGNIKCTVKGQETKTFLNVIETIPEFTRKLQDFEVKEKEVAILEVEISSETADVVWQKDGETIHQKQKKYEFENKGNLRKLLIRNASVHDEGEYLCILRDQMCSAEVTVVELPPEITNRMKDQTINEGEKASFEIELTKGDALVRWFKNGVEIQFSDHIQLSIDGKKQKLRIYNCTAADIGEYTCKVGNDVCKAALNVEGCNVDFTIKLPEKLTVPMDSNASLTVQVPEPDMEVQWYKNDTELCDTEKYTILSDNLVRKLIVKKADMDDQSNYSCVLYNNRTTCKLTVEAIEAAPKILDYEKVYEVNYETDVTINVRYTSTPKPKDEWTVSGKIISKHPRIKSKLTEENASITIRKLERIDSGEYKLRLSNNCGEAFANIKVVVLEPPSQPGTPEALDIGDDFITLHWKCPEYDGNCTPITYMLEYCNTEDNKWQKITEITNTTHTIKKLKKNSQYIFKVTAINKVGPSPASENSVKFVIKKLTVNEAPTVQQPLQDITTTLGQSIKLICIFGGIPMPTVEWYKDGVNIKENTSYENRSAMLTIIKTEETVIGKYTCKAVNVVGQAETTCYVDIKEKPSISIEEKLVHQKLKVGTQWIVEAIIRGYPKPRITWSRNDTIITSSEEIRIVNHEYRSTISISSTKRSNSGKYVIKVDNNAGADSVELSLRVFDDSERRSKSKTPEEEYVDKPCKPEGPVIMKEINNESILIEWKAPLDDGGLELTKYAIEKHDPDRQAWTKVADVDKDVKTYCVQKLNENREYMFRVMAQNPIGISDALESQPIMIKSIRDKPSPPQGPLGVCGMTSSSMTISWHIPENDGGCPILEYIVEMQLSTKKTWTSVGSSTTTYLFIDNLMKGSNIIFRIYARNEIGTSLPYTTDDTIIVGESLSPPSAPLNLTVVETTSRSATIKWSPPLTDGGSIVIGYILEYKIVTSESWTKVATVDANIQQRCFEKLKEKSDVVFRVSAENAIGVGVPAVTENVKLHKHATVPSAPTAPLEIRSTGLNSIIIEWGQPEHDGGAPLLGYNIAIRDIRKTMWMEVGRVNASIQKFNIKDLQEDHEYLIRIYARNEVGSSEPLESDEPFKVILNLDAQYNEEPNEITEITEPTGFSTETSTSWMREANMDADIRCYARGSLLRRDEYFFRIWHYAKQLFK